MTGIASGIFEIALRYRTDAYRVVFATQAHDDLRVVHSSSEEVEIRDQDTSTRGRSHPFPVEKAEGFSGMIDDDEFDVIRGSDNVFRDVGHIDADAEHLKSILAAQIIAVMDDKALSTRKAESITGIAAADFSRIRKAKLDRFTIDRLMAVLNRFDQTVEVSVIVHPRGDTAIPQPAEQDNFAWAAGTSRNSAVFDDDHSAARLRRRS